MQTGPMFLRSCPKRPSDSSPPAAIPRSVIALGMVSLFMDISSEIIHGLLPAFLVTALGVSAFSIGIIEGIAEATASVTRIFSGVFSDWIARRKPFVLLGYGLAALTKPLFPLASGVGAVLVARFIDRIGKGIRGAPRDALIGDLTPIESRGAAFGLRQSLDTIGAFVGPLLAMLLMAASHDNFRLVFWIAVIPAFVSVALVIYGVRERDLAPAMGRRPFPIQRTELARLDRQYWWLLAIATMLTLGRFSEAFLLLAAENVGLAVALIPDVLVTNVVYAASAYPFGRLSDVASRRVLLVLGVVLLIAADVVLATAGTIWIVLVGVVLWGLHTGPATQGLLSTLVVDAAPADLRGTALGMFNLVTGAALLAAGALAGWLWTASGPAATFTAGAVFAGIALLGMVALGRMATEHHTDQQA